LPAIALAEVGTQTPRFNPGDFQSPDPPAPLRGVTGLAPRTPFGTVPRGTGRPAPAAVRPNSRRPALACRLGTQHGRLRGCRVGAVPQIDRILDPGYSSLRSRFRDNKRKASR